jgi:hypothetical protein
MKYESTCIKDKCPNWLDKSSGFQCPMYRVMPWTLQPDGINYETEDCAPIRTLLITVENSQRTVALQVANEDQRNKSWQLMNTIATMRAGLPPPSKLKELPNG